MKTERTLLRCEDCESGWILRTPESQEQLHKLVESYKLCKECGGSKILMAGYMCR